MGEILTIYYTNSVLFENINLFLILYNIALPKDKFTVGDTITTVIIIQLCKMKQLQERFNI